MHGNAWINKDIKIFWGEWIDGSISFLLWIMLINIIRENDAVISDITNNIIIDLLFHEIMLDISIISLKVLIVGGAEMFKAINVNHQNVILGIIINNPLNIRVLRVLYLIYRSFTSKNKAEEEKPCAIIMIKAPVSPTRFIVNNPVKTNPIWATDE